MGVKKSFVAATALLVLQLWVSPLFASPMLSAGIEGYALGDAVTAAKQGLDAPYKNPAGLVGLKTMSIATTYSSMFDQAYSLMAVGIGGPVSNDLWISLNVPYRTVDNIPVTEDDGSGEGTQIGSFSDNTLNGLLSAAYKLSEHLSIGTTVHYYAEQSYQKSGQDLGIDAGILYSEETFSIGASVFNATTFKLDQTRNTSSGLEKTFHLGLGYRGFESVTILMDGNISEDATTALNIGGIFELNPAFRLYAGIQDFSHSSSLRLGASGYFDTFRADYAYASSAELGTVHRIGMTWEFDAHAR